MPKTMINRIGITAAKMSAISKFMENAIIIAPKTINGLLRNRRRNIFMPFCT